MRRTSARLLCLLLVASLVFTTVSPALAATYRNGAQSGPSSSYKGGKYYANYLRVPITGDNRTDVVAIALSQLGYQEGASNGYFSGEVSGRANYVEFSYNMGDLGLGYGGSDYPWCASFVSWCLYQSHTTDQGTYSSLGRFHVGDYKYIWKEISCSQWVRQLKGAGYYKYSKYEGGSYTPKYGDLVFFQNSSGVAHIGICLYVSGGRIYTIEGNTSDGSGLEANGGGVYFKNYSLSSSYLNGYGVLPYQSDNSVAKIDYSGTNPTPGLYISNAAKYIYSTETGSSYNYVMNRFTMFEVTDVCANGRLKVIAKERGGATVTGYISNNSDRVIQLSSTGVSAAETARANLQAQITAAGKTRHYNYTEAQITNLRAVYNAAVGVLNNAGATVEAMNTATANLKAAMNVSGVNTIGRNNTGIFVKGRNAVIQAGDCFIYSNLWNNGLITVDNANIRYTVNVVCGWDPVRMVNEVRSVTFGKGNATPSIQLGESEWLIAAHDWERGIASGDNPVKHSGTNYEILSNLSVGDAVYLSGATALNANTYVDPAAFLKFAPKDATKVTAENKYVGSGEVVLFTPDFNNGLLNHANANIHRTLNVLAQWDDVKSAWIVANKWTGNNTADESSNVELVDGQVLISAHVGDTSASVHYFNQLNNAKIGQEVIFSGISPTDGTTNLSISANVSFVDYAGEVEPPEEDLPEEEAPQNLASGRDYIVRLPGTSAHTAGLTDGKYTTALDFNGGWFGFACTGGNVNTDENGEGFITVDLGRMYSLNEFRMHLYAVPNDASIAPPLYIEAMVSNNGVDYAHVGDLVLPENPATTDWAVLGEQDVAARYVKLRVGPSGNSTWVFLNEFEIYGKELGDSNNIAIGTTVQGTPVEGYTGGLTNGAYEDWYGIDTSAGSGSLIIDLGDRYKIDSVLATVFADAADNGPEALTLYVSVDGTTFLNVGELIVTENAAEIYKAEAADLATVGRYLKIEAKDGDGLALLSEIEVYGEAYDQSVSSNVTLGKDYVASPFAGSGYTASLTDGVASEVFQYGVNNASWFGFLNTGDATTGNTTNNRGIITIDLGGMAEFTSVGVHIFAGANDAGAVQPQYINVYYSTDGTFYDYAGYVNPTVDADSPYWMTLECAKPLTARYVKIALGMSAGSLCLLNEVQFYGTQLTSDEATEAGSMSTTTLSGSFNNWNSTPNMQLTEDGSVTTTIALNAGVHEFKILYGNEWYGNNGSFHDFCDNWVMETGTGNCVLNASYTGNYRFTLNRSTMELSVAYVPDALYLRGSFNEWGTTMPMTAAGTNSFTYSMYLDAGTYEFKIADENYVAQWPTSNYVLEVASRSKVTFNLNLVSGWIDVIQEPCAHSTHSTEGICDDCGGVVNHSYVNGVCSGCGAAYPFTLPTVIPGGGGLAFKDEIYYNVYFMLNNPDNLEIVETGVISWTSPIDGTIDTAEYVSVGSEPYSSYFKTRSNPISAKNMGEELYMKVYAKLADGVYVYSSLINYSAKTYAMNKINDASSDPGLKALCVSLLNYGAAAQQYFGYKIDDLMNKDISAEGQTLVNAYSDAMVPALTAPADKAAGLAANDGFVGIAPSVNFGGALGMNYTVLPKKAVESDIKLYIWTEAELAANEALTLENAKEVITMNASSNSTFSGRLTGISAKNAGDTIYACAVYTSGGVEYRTGVVTYSVAAYCKSYANKDGDKFQSMAALAAVYTYYADAYLNK